MSDTRTLARGAATVTSARFLGLIFTMVQVKLTVNHLSIGDYGRLSIVTLFIGFFAGLAELGVGSVVVRRVSGEGRSLQEQVGLSQALMLALMIPTVLLCLGLGWILYNDRPVVVLGIAILTIGLLSTMWATTYNPVAQVTSKFGYSAAADLAGRVFALGTILLVINADGGLRWFFLAQLFVPLGQLVAMSTLGRRMGGFRPMFNWPAIRGLVHEALPITYLLVVGVTYFVIDGILLSKLADEADVAAYNFAYRTVGAATIVGASISTVLASRLAAVAAESPERFSRAVSRALTFVALFAAPFAAFMTPIAPDVIRFLGQEDLVAISTIPMRLLAVAIAIGMLSAVLSTAVIACYRQGVLTRLNTVTLSANIVLNVILIPRFQATGAATALVATEALGFTVVLFVLVRRSDGAFPLRAFALLVVPIIVCLGIGELLIDVPWGVRLAAMCAAYATLVLVLRITSVAEIRQLMKRRARADEAVGA